MKKIFVKLGVFLVFAACSAPFFLPYHLMVDDKSDRSTSETAIGSGTRYLDEIFTKVHGYSDVDFGDIVNAETGQVETLFLDSYFPIDDPVSDRWAVVFIHGGGFKGGDKAQPSSINFVQSLAKRGYVAVSINYPLLSYKPDTSNYLPGYQNSAAAGRLALRFLRKNMTSLRIDPSRIAVFGASAGGFGALGAAYDQALDSLLLSHSGFSGSPDFVGESAGGLPDTTHVEFHEANLYLQHCENDPRVSFQFAADLMARFDSLGKTYSSWLPQSVSGCHGNCHPIFSCLSLTTIGKFTEAVYSEFGE